MCVRRREGVEYRKIIARVLPPLSRRPSASVPPGSSLRRAGRAARIAEAHCVIATPTRFDDIRRRLAHHRRRVLDPPLRRPAAVLVPLLAQEDELHVLFTLRSNQVRVHKGEVSFPGGARHDDDRDLLETALRESHEEIGLQAEQVEVLGLLDDVLAISAYQVTPWVGRVSGPVVLTGATDETQEVFTVPVRRLLDPTLCALEERVVREVRFYPVPRFRGGKHEVWGLTGHILSRFLEIAFDWHHPDLDPSRVTAHWLR